MPPIWLEQPELHEAPHELGMQAGLAREHVDLDQRGRAVPGAGTSTPLRRRPSPPRPSGVEVRSFGELLEQLALLVAQRLRERGS